MAIDSETLKKCWDSYAEGRTFVLTLVDGSRIIPEHMHALNNCSIELLVDGVITIVPLDSVLTFGFAPNVSIEEVLD